MLREYLMRKIVALAALTALLSICSQAQEKEQKRLKHSGEVLMEILNIPDNLPKPVLDRAECVIVLPSVKKAAFGVGANIGRGAMSCLSGANFTGPWGPPAMYALEGVSLGFQLGGQATDFVLLVMNPRGAESLMGSKVKLGADAAAAAGPKGRAGTGATDVVMRNPRTGETTTCKASLAGFNPWSQQHACIGEHIAGGWVRAE